MTLQLDESTGSLLEVSHQKQFCDFSARRHIKPAARQRTCQAYIRLPQSRYKQAGLDSDDPSASNTVFLEKLPMMNKKCFVNTIHTVPFVMD